MFQRLMAIPQEEYVKLTAIQQARQPMTQQFYNLEKQYSEQDAIRNPYQRLIMQSETLDEMKDLKEKMRQDLSVTTPKPYRNRVHALYQSMQPFLNFNERGEIYDKQGRLISQSRLEDLIQHAVRDRRRTIQPVGWNEFRQLIQEHNVPKASLNRFTLDEMNHVPTAPSVRAKPRKRKKMSPIKTESPTQRPKRVKKPVTMYGDFKYFKS